MTTRIIYHENCMDGIASAFIAKHTLSEHLIYDEDKKKIETLPVQYYQEQKIFDLELAVDDIIYFVDFSLKRDKMVELCSKVGEVIVIDHHKTAQVELQDLDKELDNIKVHFDMNKSGATLCHEYFKSDLNKEIFEYIADRDLWKWKLPYTKEISAYLRLEVKPNDLESFEEIYSSFDKYDAAEIGGTLLKQQEIQVKSKIKKTKDIAIDGINFKILNATENISEIGNAICIEYNTPAMVYFFTDKDEVVCSFRSIDTLPDVSVVAKALGGGGHRNACGCTLNMSEFYNLVQGKDMIPELIRDTLNKLEAPDRQEELEALIKIWFIMTDKWCPDTTWFEVKISSIYKKKCLTVLDIRDNKQEHIITTTGTTTKEIYDKAFKYFDVENSKEHLCDSCEIEQAECFLAENMETVKACLVGY